jgi:hypothetical protein
MQYQYFLALSLMGVACAIHTYRSVEGFHADKNATFVLCDDDSPDPICALVKRPTTAVMTSTLLPDGTWSEAVPSNWTREALKAVREANGVISNERRSFDPIANLTLRESAPPVCWTERQKWYDQSQWGYWYQAWHQIGSCFYCDSCSEAIAASFAVTQTWTVGIGADFDNVMHVSFDYSWGQTATLSDTRTCNWSLGDTYGCHSIWYQPLMSWHHGWPNYQTHTHCGAGQGQGPTDSYYDHHYTYAEANQAANGGVNQGNLGCGSGCQGSDHRQCSYGNDGGILWPNAN